MASQIDIYNSELLYNSYGKIKSPESLEAAKRLADNTLFMYSDTKQL